MKSLSDLFYINDGIAIINLSGVIINVKVALKYLKSMSESVYGFLKDFISTDLT